MVAGAGGVVVVGLPADPVAGVVAGVVLAVVRPDRSSPLPVEVEVDPEAEIALGAVMELTVSVGACCVMQPIASTAEAVMPRVARVRRVYTIRPDLEPSRDCAMQDRSRTWKENLRTTSQPFTGRGHDLSPRRDGQKSGVSVPVFRAAASPNGYSRGSGSTSVSQSSVRSSGSGASRASGAPLAGCGSVSRQACRAWRGKVSPGRP